MNIPDGQPFTGHGRAIMDAGKAIENEYVSRWEEDGVLISRPPTDKHQTGFKDERYWLTGNLDAVIHPPGWNRGHAVEIKSKDHDVIDSMKSGLKSYDEQHYYQLQVYLGFLQSNSDSLYADYYLRRPESILRLDKPVTTGSILYVSRNRPRHTHEFTFEFDLSVWVSGTSSLAAWREEFTRGNLPPRNPNWKWLDQPCKWCPVKRICKADDKQNKLRLSDSTAIDTAKQLRPDYEYLQQRKNVLERWGVEDESSD